MRIGIDVRCLADGKHTGVEEYVQALLNELFTQDTVNEYVLFFNARKDPVPAFVESIVAQYPNVSLVAFRFPNKLLNICLWYFGLPHLDRLVGGTDIFFLPNLNFAAVSNRSKLVVTAHDLSFELFPEMFSWKRRAWHFLVHFRRLVYRADRVIAISRSTQDDLVARYGISASKIALIPSGIDNRFRPMSRNDVSLVSVKEKYGLPYRFILYLGTFEPRKNILAIVRAYEALIRTGGPAVKQYALVLAGSHGWKCKELLAAIDASPYRDRIILPGFIDDEDKAALYNVSSVFVYPSFYEGFGFPPLEAMACGVPSVVSHSSSLPEVVGDAAIMIDPYQPDELFRAFSEIIGDQTLRDELRTKGIAQAARFRWSETAKKTLSLFQSLR